MTSTPEDMPPRITEVDRETAVNRVQRAFVESVLSHAELEERLQAVLTAETVGELASALASVPDDRPARTSTIAAKGGRIQRRGAWRVPRILKIESTHGKVNLDFSRAVIENPVVDIELRLRHGDVRITLPRDAVVDIEDLQTEWQQPVYKIPRGALRGGPQIRITGNMEYGRLRIRHKRR